MLFRSAVQEAYFGEQGSNLGKVVWNSEAGRWLFTFSGGTALSLDARPFFPTETLQKRLKNCEIIRNAWRVHRENKRLQDLEVEFNWNDKDCPACQEAFVEGGHSRCQRSYQPRDEVRANYHIYLVPLTRKLAALGIDPLEQEEIQDQVRTHSS